MKTQKFISKCFSILMVGFCLGQVATAAHSQSAMADDYDTRVLLQHQNELLAQQRDLLVEQQKLMQKQKEELEKLNSNTQSWWATALQANIIVYGIWAIKGKLADIALKLGKGAATVEFPVVFPKGFLERMSGQSNGTEASVYQPNVKPAGTDPTPASLPEAPSVVAATART